jgi:hypothetical protein
MSRQRFNIVVTIKRNDQPSYTNIHNHQPLRPGKVNAQFLDAIESVMSNVTRGGKYGYTGAQTDRFFFAESEGIIVIITVDEVEE